MMVSKTKQCIDVDTLNKFLKENTCSIDTNTGELLYVDKSNPDEWKWMSVIDNLVQTLPSDKELVEREILASYTYNHNDSERGIDKTLFYQDQNGCYLHEFQNGFTGATRVTQVEPDYIDGYMEIIRHKALTDQGYTIIKDFDPEQIENEMEQSEER